MSRPADKWADKDPKDNVTAMGGLLNRARSGSTETSPPPRKRGSGVKRSWWLEVEVADELNEKADELYYDLRGKVEKKLILGALIRKGIDNVEAARKELEKRR